MLPRQTQIVPYIVAQNYQKNIAHVLLHMSSTSPHLLARLRIYRRLLVVTLVLVFAKSYLVTTEKKTPGVSVSTNQHDGRRLSNLST